MVLSDTFSNIFGRTLPAFGTLTAGLEERAPVVVRKATSPFRTRIQRSAAGPVAVVSVADQLDGRNYLDFIATVEELWDGGAERVVVDVSNVASFGLAGIYALHAVVRLLHGQAYPPSEYGRRAVERLCEWNAADGRQDKVLLVDRSGREPAAFTAGALQAVFPIYSSQEASLAACDP